ncbi:hypothetical protein AVEN_153031-1 [Araneus ventricosus]|uniref:Integrase p58-like C-terminal domain-containing protein n=1 Tax=Araneus ventricosus TaxID=182803 RepID=A0A4Y2NA98_ARAVE|nr:hypothetical protein AVEN_153031-1 [Araneus ventricosus]
MSQVFFPGRPNFHIFVVTYWQKLFYPVLNAFALAVTKMTEVNDKRKVWYDKKAVKREFRVRNLVLVLATSKPNKMAVQWTGPGVIESQISDTNYIVKMEGKKDKTEICHVDLLKPYHQRPELINLIVNGGEEIQERETEELAIPYPVSDPNIYDF